MDFHFLSVVFSARRPKKEEKYHAAEHPEPGEATS
jgi:hypothetical protein